MFRYLKKKFKGLRTSAAHKATSGNAEEDRDHEAIFTKRYGLRKLKDPIEGSYSGPGSTVVRTEAIREAIPALLKELDCKILIDAPCGDFKWMQTIELPVEKYIGAEVIKDLVEVNNKTFGDAQRSFIHIDLVQDVLPKGDVVLNRDMLIHLSFSDIHRFIEQLKKSGSEYLLTSHFPKQTENTDIKTGEWRPVNLEIEPFNFPKPLTVISEKYTANPLHSDKSLALWRVADLPSNQFAA